MASSPFQPALARERREVARTENCSVPILAPSKDEQGSIGIPKVQDMRQTDERVGVEVDDIYEKPNESPHPYIDVAKSPNLPPRWNRVENLLL